MASWSILPTTADVGFLAEAENIVELFKISSLALQSIRYGFTPGSAISWGEGEQNKTPWRRAVSCHRITLRRTPAADSAVSVASKKDGRADLFHR